MTAQIAAELAATREHLRVGGAHGSGSSWQASWTGAVDRAVRAASDASCLPSGVAVVALGGYGRAELAPRSDIDLLVVHLEGRPRRSDVGGNAVSRDRLATLVRAIADPLWSLGCTVGHAVRSVGQAVERIDDIAILTAMLDGRFIAGDPAVAATLSTALRRRARAEHAKILTRLLAEDRRRQERFGTSADRLEPHLKNGAGGLRDLQSLRWAATVLASSPAPRAPMETLVSSAYLAAADLPRLARAHRRIQSARVVLHLAGGDDVLRLDDHEQFAQVHRDRLAAVATTRPGAGAAVPLDELHARLREVMLAMRVVEHAHRRAWALIGADLEHGRRRRTRRPERTSGAFSIQGGVLTIPALDQAQRERSLLDDESFALQLLTVLIDHRLVIDRRAAAMVRSAAEQSTARWSWHVDVRRAAIESLWSGRGVVAAIAELDDAGVIGCLMPEWEPLRGRAQRNPYHRFTLDSHAWHAVEQLGQLVAEESWARRALDRVDDSEGLLLAVLLHDVGKAVGEPHAETGVEPARVLAARMAAARPTVDLVGRLTRWHLLLTDTARRRDIADPAVVLDVARTVEDRSMLAALHLLTVADGRATGPSAWNPWVAGLVADLVARVEAVLDGRSADDTPTGPAATTAAAFARAGHERVPPGIVRRHVAAMPDRYPAAVGAEEIVQHATMAVAVRAQRGTVQARHAGVGSAQTAGPCRLDVVGFDRPGMFTAAVEAITAQGGDIHAADLFSARDGITVLTIHASAPGDADPGWWQRISAYLEAGHPVPRRRGTDRRSVSAAEAPATVTIRRAAAGDLLEIDIDAPDTPGLLRRLLGVLEDGQLEPVAVRATTVGTRANDVLTARGAPTLAESPPDMLGPLCHALRTAADQREAPTIAAEPREHPIIM